MKSFFYIYKRLTLACGLCLLAACAHLQEPLTEPYSTRQQSTLLPALEHWQAEGKLGLTMGADSQSASFTWHQQGRRFAIHIFGPFGHGSTHLSRDAEGRVTLANPELGTHRAASAEALMTEVLGWQVPVSAMQYWIKGMPAPQEPFDMITGNDGLPAQLLQAGWQVRFTRYQSVGRWQLPERVVATRDDLRLVVVVKQWQIGRREFW